MEMVPVAALSRIRGLPPGVSGEGGNVETQVGNQFGEATSLVVRGGGRQVVCGQEGGGFGFGEMLRAGSFEIFEHLGEGYDSAVENGALQISQTGFGVMDAIYSHRAECRRSQILCTK